MLGWFTCLGLARPGLRMGLQWVYDWFRGGLGVWDWGLRRNASAAFSVGLEPGGFEVFGCRVGLG